MARFSSINQPHHTHAKKGEFWKLLPLEALPIEARLALAYHEHGSWILGEPIAPLAFQALRFATIIKASDNYQGRWSIRDSCRRLVPHARNWRDLYEAGHALDPRIEPAQIKINAARHLFRMAWPFAQDPFPFAPCEWEKRERAIAAYTAAPVPIGPLQPPSNEPPIVPTGVYYEEIDPEEEITDIMSNWKK